MLKKIYDWIVVSSADPTKLALTVKGFLSFVVSFALLVSPIIGWKFQLDPTTIDNLVHLIVQFIVLFSAVLSAIAAFYGLVRKIYLTLKNP